MTKIGGTSGPVGPGQGPEDAKGFQFSRATQAKVDTQRSASLKSTATTKLDSESMQALEAQLQRRLPEDSDLAAILNRGGENLRRGLI